MVHFFEELWRFKGLGLLWAICFAILIVALKQVPQHISNTPLKVGFVILCVAGFVFASYRILTSKKQTEKSVKKYDNQELLPIDTVHVVNPDSTTVYIPDSTSYSPSLYQTPHPEERMTTNKLIPVNSDNIYGTWYVQMKHIKNDCNDSKAEGQSSELWRIYKHKGSIMIVNAKSEAVGLGSPIKGVLDGNYLELNGIEVFQNDTTYISGIVVFDNDAKFSGRIRELSLRKCITTYKIYGDK